VGRVSQVGRVGQVGRVSRVGQAGRVGRDGQVNAVLYYVGRGGQILGMWILLVDVVTAGPLGPNPKLFGVGVVAFLAGWGLTRFTRGGAS